MIPHRFFNHEQYISHALIIEEELRTWPAASSATTWKKGHSVVTGMAVSKPDLGAVAAKERSTGLLPEKTCQEAVSVEPFQEA